MYIFFIENVDIYRHIVKFIISNKIREYLFCVLYDYLNLNTETKVHLLHVCHETFSKMLICLMFMLLGYLKLYKEIHYQALLVYLLVFESFITGYIDILVQKSFIFILCF